MCSMFKKIHFVRQKLWQHLIFMLLFKLLDDEMVTLSMRHYLDSVPFLSDKIFLRSHCYVCFIFLNYVSSKVYFTLETKLY